MSEDAIQQIQLDIEDARRLVEDAQALDRLFENKDFKRVIKEGYFKEEPARLAEIKAAPQMRGEQYQTAIIKEIDGIGCLQQYFNKIWALADQARRSIESGEEEIEAIENAEVSH